VKVIYAGVEVCRKEGKKKLSVICVEVMFREQEEMRVLRGVVYMTKSSGPRTEPWGTLQEDVFQEDRSVSHLTWKQRDDRYDEPAENRAMDTKPG